jgi:hypothetical protein
MSKRDDFKIELPHGVKQDILIDLLIQNLAYSKILSNILVEDFAQKNFKNANDAYKEFNDSVKQTKYEILAFIASKYGK